MASSHRPSVSTLLELVLSDLEIALLILELAPLDLHKISVL